jgi:anti-anti-sigma regulatory factor
MSLVSLPLPRPARPPVRLASVLHGREALVTATGTIDRKATAGIAALLRGLCDAGATRVLVDLATVSSCDRSLAAALNSQRRRLAASGGWLVVDGSPATLGDDLDLSLTETFRIYREVQALTAGG